MKYCVEKTYFFSYLFSGGLPANLRFGPTGLTTPAATGGSTNPAPTLGGQVPRPPTGTGNAPPSSDPSNYAGVFAQMLDMMSNQNIVCFEFSQIFYFVYFNRTLHLHNVMLFN